MGIIYEKEQHLPAVKRSVLRLVPGDGSEGETGRVSPAVCRNLRFENGALRTLAGLKPAGVSLGAQASGGFEWKGKAYYLVNGALLAQNGTSVSDTGLRYASLPVALPYRSTAGEEWLVLAGEGVVAYTGGGTKALSSHSAVAAAVHYERLFLADRNSRVYFSDALDLANWTQGVQEAGYVDLPSDYGEIRKAVSFDERLYLFRDYGVTELRAFGDNRNFKAVHRALPSGKVYPETIAVCGNALYFFSESGLYKSDGDKETRLFPALTKAFDGAMQTEARGAFGGGKYALSAKTAAGEGRILVADVGRESAYLLCDEAKVVCGGGEIRLQKDGLLYGLGDGTGKAEWQSGVIEALTGRKFIRELRLYGSGALDCVFSNGREERSFSVLFRDGFARACPMMPGRNFTLEITGEKFSLAAVEVAYAV